MVGEGEEEKRREEIKRNHGKSFSFPRAPVILLLARKGRRVALRGLRQQNRQELTYHCHLGYNCHYHLFAVLGMAESSPADATATVDRTVRRRNCSQCLARMFAVLFAASTASCAAAQSIKAIILSYPRSVF